MLAIFIEKQHFTISEIISLEGPAFHHIVHVHRSKVDDELLLLAGDGISFRAKIITITKKSFSLEILKIFTAKRKHHLSWGIGLSKIKATEEIIKRAIELEIENVYFFPMHYSQMQQSYPISSSRLNALIQSSMIQSNATFIPEFHWYSSLKEGIMSSYKEKEYILWGHSDFSTKNERKFNASTKDSSILMCVGPEGGLSPTDIDTILNNDTTFIQLQTPILRSELAITVLSGFIFSQLGLYHIF